MYALKLGIGVIVAMVCLWLALCATLAWFQGSLIYHPTPEVIRPGYQFERVHCGSASIQVWELHAQMQPAILYFGGNGDDVGAFLSDFDTAFPAHAVYLVSYRGYGGSTGTPSEEALIADALTIHDWVARRHPRISVIGRSLGTGVATSLAARRPVERLILVTPFDSLTNVAADLFPYVPVRWLLRDHYDSVQRIGQVHAPILVMVAGHDMAIPKARSDALIAAIPPPQRHTLLIKEATHDDIVLSPDYFPSLKHFIDGM